MLGWKWQKKIGGLRAVFGEQYPDPVRVVSVGPGIDDMLKAPSKMWGSDASIEFCGGTHVQNCAEIYKLVLITEEGIAKGVRRIVAVTSGQAAVEASLRSQKFRVDVDEARTLAGQLLEEKLATLRTALQDEKQMGIVTRKDLLKEIDGLKEGVLKAGKAATKDDAKRAREDGECLAAEATKVSGKTFVAVASAGDAKNLGLSMEVLSKKCTDKGLCLLATGGGRLAVVCVVPTSLQGEMSAKAWSDKILEAIGGKGGGKTDKAQGQCSDPSKLEDGLKAAKAYA